MGVFLYFTCCRVIQFAWSSTHLLAYSYFHTHLYPLYSPVMDESKIDTQEPAWISSRNRIEAHEDITLRSPKFSPNERFLVCGGGAPFEMYCRIMEIIFPKDSNVVTNIMNDLQLKATNNLKAIRTIYELNGIFGLHDRI